MVKRKNKSLKNKKMQKKATNVIRNKNILSKKKNDKNQLNILIPLILSSIQKMVSAVFVFILNSLKSLLKAPFLFINIFYSTIFLFFKNTFIILLNFVKNLFINLFKLKEIFFGIFFGIVSGGIGAILAVSYLELSSNNQKEVELSENYKKVTDKINIIEDRLNEAELEIKKSNSVLADIKGLQSDFLDSDKKYTELENNFKSMSLSLEKIEEDTTSLESNLSNLSKDLKSNSRLILSSSKTELSNRLYLAQSLLDRLESGVPYSPQLKALGKEGLDPALLRFAAGGAPTLKDLEARLSARAGEQLDADRTKRDNTWRENLKREISKYVKIKPTNINEIKGVTGALLRAESSISKGNLSKAIEEISSVPERERGPLDAWLKEAIARQNADIAAKNLLAKTTAALKQKN